MKYKSKLQLCLLTIKCGRIAAISIIICKILSGFILPYTAYAYQNLIDAILASLNKNTNISVLYIPLLMVIVIYIFQAVEEPVGNYCRFLTRQRLEYYFDRADIEKITRIQYSRFENSDDLDRINRIDGTSGSAAMDLFDNIFDFVSGIIKIVGTFALLMTYNYMLAIVVFLAGIPIMVVSAKYGRTFYNWYQINSQERRYLEYLSTIFTDKNASLEIKEYNFYGYLNSKWKTCFQDLRNKDFKLQVKAWKNTVLSSLLLNLFEYSAYIILLFPTLGEMISIGTFVGLSKALSSIEGLIIWDFSSIFSFFSQSANYWKDYAGFMALSEVCDCEKDVQDIHIKRPLVEFKNVCFRYDNMDYDVLHNVSFTIEANELCGLVGVNGAGKSTLAKLMIGLYQPDSGDIILNGKNTKAMAFSEQIGYFGITYQDFSRYNISVKENVALSERKAVNSQKIEEILHSLRFDYKKLPHGIDTIAGRLFGDGVDLSGGEWQKIAIARMMYKDALLNIMDEPTASLDPISEAKLYKQIKEVLSVKTSLLITHRLGAVSLCDKILVLDGGKIAEMGTSEELLERGELYAQMYNEQKQWYSK